MDATHQTSQWKEGGKAQHVQILKLVTNRILLYVHQLVLVSVRFVGLLLVLTDIVGTDLSQYFTGRITDSLNDASCHIVEAVSDTTSKILVQVSTDDVSEYQQQSNKPDTADTHKAVSSDVAAHSYSRETQERQLIFSLDLQSSLHSLYTTVTRD